MEGYKDILTARQGFIFDKLNHAIDKMVSHEELLMYVDEEDLGKQKKALAVQISKIRKIVDDNYLIFPIVNRGYMLIKKK